MAKLSSLRTDMNASEDGIKVIIEGVNLTLAKWGNKKHTAFIKEFSKKYGEQMQSGAMSDEESDRLFAEQFVHIVKNIKNLEDDNGDTIEFSHEMLLAMARNEEFDDFFIKIERAAKNQKSYRVESIKALGEALPNS